MTRCLLLVLTWPILGLNRPNGFERLEVEDVMTYGDVVAIGEVCISLSCSASRRLDPVPESRVAIVCHPVVTGYSSLR